MNFNLLNLNKKYLNKNFQLLIFSHNDKFEKLSYKQNLLAENIIKYTSNYLFTKNDEKQRVIVGIEKAINDRFEINPECSIVADKVLIKKEKDAQQ